MRWAVELLDPGPADAVLEIGPGVGSSVPVLLDALPGGTVTVADRSSGATSTLDRRHAAAVADGRLRVHHVAMEDAAFDVASFDRILAINVNAFWTRDASADLRRVRGWLRPRGVSAIVYEPPDAARVEDIVARVRPALDAAGLAAEVHRAPGDDRLVAFVARAA